jgi:flagellar protein FlgJ
MSSGMMDNNATEMAGGMLDQQYSQQLTGLPGGLADAITKQLERQLGVKPTTPAAGAASGSSQTGALDTPAGGVGSAGTGLRRAAQQVSAAGRSNADVTTPGRPSAQSAQSALAPAAAAGAAGAAPASAGLQRAQDFLHKHRSAAEVAAQGSSIPADFLLAQAAHETGWGQREIRNADGSSANNLFGIKAGGDWTGPVATATTTEVIDGVAHKVQARFRAYASAQESFRDYANLIASSPRYAGVAGSGGDARSFAQGLQRAGYATDPDYAGKLGRVINTTLRLNKLST